MKFCCSHRDTAYSLQQPVLLAFIAIALACYSDHLIVHLKYEVEIRPLVLCSSEG